MGLEIKRQNEKGKDQEKKKGAEGMAQKLRALTALAEDQGLISSAVWPLTTSNSSWQGSYLHRHQAHIWFIYVGKTYIYNNKSIKNKDKKQVT